MTNYGIVGYSTVVLIQDGDKNILYDCGLKGCALQLKEALNQCGVTPDDITDVVLSHLHFDHVGNLPLFKNATVLLSETEWTNSNQKPDEWQSQTICEYIKNRCKYQFLKEGDLLTDSVRVMELPGHTMGLLGLKCGEDTILCSDALKNRYEMWDNIGLMSVDYEKSVSSQERIKREAKIIYPGHDIRLCVDNPIHKEDIHFGIRFANGTVIDI